VFDSSPRRAPSQLAFRSYPHGKDGKCSARCACYNASAGSLKCRLSSAEGQYLFPLRVGNGYDWTEPMSELDPAHRTALRDSKITPAFRIYDLRHTYGTRAIEGGTDPLSLMKLMGHEELSTTLRYVHLSKRHLGDAQVKIEQYRAEREIAEVEELKTAQSETQRLQ
jgi:integrase